MGTRTFVLAQAAFAFIGNGLMCSLWGPIMERLVDGYWWPWALCWVIVGVFSATGYGAFLFAVRCVAKPTRQNKPGQDTTHTPP